MTTSHSFEDLGRRVLPPKKDISPRPPKSSNANALLILSKRSSEDAPFSTAVGTEGLEVLIPASRFGAWDQMLPTPARPLNREPVKSPPLGAPGGGSVEVSALWDTEELFPKKLNPPEGSNLEGEGGDWLGLKTVSESKLVARCGGIATPILARCTRFVRLPKLGDRLRPPKKLPPMGPEGASFGGRSLMLPKLELRDKRLPEPSANGSGVGDVEKNSCKSPLLARRDIRGIRVIFSSLRSERFALAPTNELVSRLRRLSLELSPLPALRANDIRFPPLAFRTRLPRLIREDVVVVVKPSVLAVVVRGLGLVIPSESPRDAKIVLKMPPPEDGVIVGETGGGALVGCLLIGLPSRSFSLKYFAKLLRDSARAGSLSDASLLALSKTLAKTCPTESFAGEASEVVFKRDAKILPG